MIDQEIRDALNVDPSPEFLARVRTRIANEPAPSRWRWSWTFAVAGAMAAVLLITVVVSRRAHQPASAPDVAQAFRPAITSPSPATETAGPKGPAQQASKPDVPQAFRPAIAGLKPGAASRNASDATVRLKPDTAESPLLFDHSEMRALQALIAGVRDGRIDLAAAQTSVPLAPMELAPVADIVIDPIIIEPIAPPSGAEGVRP